MNLFKLRLLGISVLFYSITINAQVEIPVNNFNPFTAVNLCENSGKTVASSFSENLANCKNNTVERNLFYVLPPNIGFNGTVFDYQFDSNSTGISHVMFGPFNTIAEGVLAINTNSSLTIVPTTVQPLAPLSARLLASGINTQKFYFVKTSVFYTCRTSFRIISNINCSFLDNLSPGGATNLCSPVNDNYIFPGPSQKPAPLVPPISNANVGPCINDNYNLFFVAPPNTTFTAGSNVVLTYTPSSTTTSIEAFAYGPFNTMTEGVDAINQMLAVAFSPTIVSLSGNEKEVRITNPVASKFYFIQLRYNSCSGQLLVKRPQGLACTSITADCKNCIKSFRPGPGKYVISAWVKKNIVPDPLVLTYFKAINGQGPEIRLTSPSASFTAVRVKPSGVIIDGWQRMEGTFVLPNPEVEWKMELTGDNINDFYFDDVRIHPNDASAMTYVYDPKTLRLSAELDERNYATFYEYDEEGHLVRIKKETENGIMTIQENRENSIKQP